MTGHQRSGSRRGRTRLAVFIAVLGLLALTLAGWRIGTHADDARNSEPLAWQAFYLPGNPTVLVHADRGPCAVDVSATSTGGSITIAAKAAHIPVGHGMCVMGISSSRFHLEAAVRRPTFHAARGSVGTAYDLSARLHRPVAGNGDLPFGAEVSPVSGGESWMLAYESANRVAYFIKSVPDDHHHHALPGTVRGHPAVTPCAETLCWREDNLLYSIGTLDSSDQDSPRFSRADALAIAATLT